MKSRDLSQNARARALNVPPRRINEKQDGGASSNTVRDVSAGSTKAHHEAELEETQAEQLFR